MMYPKIDNAQTTILSCLKLGINNVVISPGSRNAPLAISFASSKDFNCYSIVDERSAGFFALGIAQQTKSPVILLCTSGSALLNYAPSVAEAFYSEIPLIILSADRPKYKINIGDGQTISQLNVFGENILSSDSLRQDVNHETKSIISSNQQNLISDDLSTEKIKKLQLDIQKFNEKLLNKRLNESTLLQKPVHINIPMEEPLYGFTKKPTVNLTSTKRIKKSFEEKKYKKYADLIAKSSKVMILVGSSKPNCLSNSVINNIRSFSNIIVLTESTSNLNNDAFFQNIDQIIAPLELIDDKENWFKKLSPEILITLGGMIISKKIKSFLRSKPPKLHLHIGLNKANDTYFSGVKHIKTSPNLFFKKTLSKKHKSSDFYNLWNGISTQRASSHQKFIRNANYSDLIVFSILSSRIPKRYLIQVSNSSPIRYLQLFKISFNNVVYCNRGTSGIDGSTSTAVGASLENKSPTLLITGDLSFFYDVNGLWNNYIKPDFRIIIINNSGGGIFRILPGHKDDAIFSKFIETKHSLNAKKIAQQYGFDYQHKKTQFGLKFALKRFFNKSTKPKILEVSTPSELSSETLKNYFKFLSKN